MKTKQNILESRSGFTLSEVLATMIIGSMVLIAVLNIYNKLETSAAAVNRTMNNSALPQEVLQLIAEDFDKVITTDSDTNIIIINKFSNDYNTALMVIRVLYKDATDKEQKYEEIYWQCNANSEGDANDMVLYRSYEGVVPQDKLLDKNKTASEKSVYVPICGGITYFNIKIITDKKEMETVWPGGVPNGIVVTISFAQPYKNEEGHYDVPENEKYSRTIAIDKTRKIKFDIPGDKSADVNDVPGQTNVPDKPKTTAERLRIAR
jgi:prepilin-type N-terminal cleavage/methylation domain-containing protein